MEWARARTREQKEQRVQEIVEATARLYKDHAFEDITFVAIAREAGFTRSNLYKYFKSKEDIFLEFLKQDLALWKRELADALGKSRSYSLEDFAKIWVQTQIDHGRLLDLISILHVFLEKNTTVENLVAFKTLVTKELESLSGLMIRLFPEMTPEKVLRFFHLQLAAAVGLHQMANLSEVQSEVLQKPEFKHFQVDFGLFFQDAVRYILKGLLTE